MTFWKLFLKYLWKEGATYWGTITYLALQTFFVLSVIAARGIDIVGETNKPFD
jgi:hypothetical protein